MKKVVSVFCSAALAVVSASFFGCSKSSDVSVASLIQGLVEVPTEFTNEKTGKQYKIKMCKYPVTQAQWQAVMGRNPSKFKGDANPVENVSWEDCQQFISKLNLLPDVQKAKLTFRLPTKEEWMDACMAGSEGGDCMLDDDTEIKAESVSGDSDGGDGAKLDLEEVAWFAANGDAATHPVGQKKPNAFGLYDMHGNVWEWTQTGKELDRVCCGGSYSSSAQDCRATYESATDPTSRDDSVGFRLCVTVKSE